MTTGSLEEIGSFFLFLWTETRHGDRRWKHKKNKEPRKVTTHSCCCSFFLISPEVFADRPRYRSSPVRSIGKHRRRRWRRIGRNQKKNQKKRKTRRICRLSSKDRRAIDRCFSFFLRPTWVKSGNESGSGNGSGNGNGSSKRTTCEPIGADLKTIDENKK